MTHAFVLTILEYFYASPTQCFRLAGITSEGIGSLAFQDVGVEAMRLEVGVGSAGNADARGIVSQADMVPE